MMTRKKAKIRNTGCPKKSTECCWIHDAPIAVVVVGGVVSRKCSSNFREKSKIEIAEETMMRKRAKIRNQQESEIYF